MGGVVKAVGKKVVKPAVKATKKALNPKSTIVDKVLNNKPSLPKKEIKKPSILIKGK